MGQGATELVILELVRSATETFDRILLLNAHGGQRRSTHSRRPPPAAREGRDVRAWNPRRGPGRGDAHAGLIETSVMLALAPDRVDMTRAAPGATQSLGELLTELERGGVAAVSPNGVLGDPSGASSAYGEKLLAEAVAQLTRFVAPVAGHGGGSGAGAGGDPMSRVALVTGAARGIGAATVAQLNAEGWSIVAVDRAADDPRLPYAMGTPEQLDTVVSACTDAVGFHADVADRVGMAAAVAKVASRSISSDHRDSADSPTHRPRHATRSPAADAATRAGRRSPGRDATSPRRPRHHDRPPVTAPCSSVIPGRLEPGDFGTGPRRSPSPDSTSPPPPEEEASMQRRRVI